MNTAEIIYQQVQSLPEFQAEQVLRFIDSLKTNPADLNQSQLLVNQEELILEKERAIYLTAADMAFFVEALEHPAPASQSLKRAAQRHQQLIHHT
jgi:hypothetical protein